MSSTIEASGMTWFPSDIERIHPLPDQRPTNVG
jgi:hypothetical protein